MMNECDTIYFRLFSVNKADRRANFSIKYFLCDILIIVAAYALAYNTTPARFNTDYAMWYLILMISFCVVFFLFMMLFRMYNASTFFYVDRILKNTTMSLSGSAVLIFLFLFFLYNTEFSRLFFLTFLPVSILMLNIEKLLIVRAKKHSTTGIKIIYVGDESLYQNFIRYTQISGYNFNVLGYININGAYIPGVKCLGALDGFEAILKANPCDHVIFTQSLAEKRSIEPYLAIANEMGIVVRLVLDVYEINTSKWYVSSIGTYPMITYYNVTLDPVSLAIKRCVDIFGALAGIVLSLPVMLVTAIAIMLDSPGPIIFKQKRVGRNGQVFEIFKFRSMYADAEQRKAELMAHNQMSDCRLFKMKDDPRVTRVGRFIRETSIDELPQFFNVLFGSMSLVGTRPPTVAEVEQYDRHHYRRISIKPGITGIWQTSGRNEIKDFEKITQMDIDYIEKWSVMLDIRLMFKTMQVLLNRKGAY